MQTIDIFGNQFLVPLDALIKETQAELKLRDKILRKWTEVKIFLTPSRSSDRIQALDLFKKIIDASENLESCSFVEKQDVETEWELSFEKNEQTWKTWEEE